MGTRIELLLVPPPPKLKKLKKISMRKGKTSRVHVFANVCCKSIAFRWNSLWGSLRLFSHAAGIRTSEVLPSMLTLLARAKGFKNMN